ncbi:MAG: DUF3943 domain-containing protein [Myxococcales bacterium]|nr:DUF3943 domain-containing protein [Myxococcales bacterium]
MARLLPILVAVSIFGSTFGQTATALAQTQLPEPPAVELIRPDEGWWIDRSGRVRPFERTYSDWSPERYEAHPWRAAAEMLGILAIGTAWYWIKAEDNREDWDFPSLNQRLLTFEALTFDNNRFITNHVLHPAAGSAYYGFSRVNGLGPYASIGYSMASSAFFEWGLEILEKVSINDLLFTPLGAWASGEWFFQLGDYLNSAPRRSAVGTRVAKYTLGAPRYLHDLWDDVPPPPELPADNLGFSTAFWHRFGLDYGLAAVDNNRGSSKLAHDVVLSGELIRMPGFLRPGHFERGFGEGNFVDMRTRMTFDDTGWADIDIWFSADITGYFHQDFEHAPGGVRGQAWSGALNTAGRFTDRWLLQRRDGVAVAHLPGPAIRGWIADGALLFRVSAAAHLDFAAIYALPYERWIERYGSAGTKSVLQKHSYYYAHGGSAVGSASLAYEGTELGVRASFGHYESIEGFDREQTSVLRDVHNADEIIEGALWLGHTTPGAPLHIGISAEETYRVSRMPPLDEVRWDRRIAINLGLGF